MMDEKDHSIPFQVMAQRIIHNAGGEFGGACVIVPPATGYDQPVELLMLGPQSDPAQFLSTVMSRIQIMLREIEDRQRMQQGFGPR